MVDVVGSDVLVSIRQMATAILLRMVSKAQLPAMSSDPADTDMGTWARVIEDFFGGLIPTEMNVDATDMLHVFLLLVDWTAVSELFLTRMGRPTNVG